jgi:20S proteasome alpha/beta subunit
MPRRNRRKSIQIKRKNLLTIAQNMNDCQESIRILTQYTKNHSLRLDVVKNILGLAKASESKEDRNG